VRHELLVLVQSVYLAVGVVFVLVCLWEGGSSRPDRDEPRYYWDLDERRKRGKR
jgi:hypothetical protein